MCLEENLPSDNFCKTVNKIKPRNADDIKEVITDKSSHLVRSAQNFGAQVFEKNEVNDE